MDVSVFFQPVEPPVLLREWQAPLRLHDCIQGFFHEFPDPAQADALVMSASLHDHEVMPGRFRQHLYSLSAPVSPLNLADLGHLKPRQSPDDTLEQLTYVLAQLRLLRKPILLLLDDPVLSLAQVRAFEEAEMPIEYVHIDSQFDLLDADLLLDHQSYHHALLQSPPAWLFEYVQLGYQRYFVGEEQLQWLAARDFTAVRYGQLMDQIHEAEPYLRTAQVVAADLSAVRASDAPGANALSPGGFSAEEFCRMARYTGLGYHPVSFSLSGWSPRLDQRDQTTRLAALAAWYFFDGLLHRFDDAPREDRANLTQYAVQLHASIPSIDFFKHHRSERWWMAVPYPDQLGERYPRVHLVPCSESDYTLARNDEIPPRWWSLFHKLSQPS